MGGRRSDDGSAVCGADDGADGTADLFDLGLGVVDGAQLVGESGRAALVGLGHERGCFFDRFDHAPLDGALVRRGKAVDQRQVVELDKLAFEDARQDTLVEPSMA